MNRAARSSARGPGADDHWIGVDAVPASARNDVMIKDIEYDGRLQSAPAARLAVASDLVAFIDRMSARHRTTAAAWRSLFSGFGAGNLRASSAANTCGMWLSPERTIVVVLKNDFRDLQGSMSDWLEHRTWCVGPRLAYAGSALEFGVRGISIEQSAEIAGAIDRGARTASAVLRRGFDELSAVVGGRVPSHVSRRLDEAISAIEAGRRVRHALLAAQAEC